MGSVCALYGPPYCVLAEGLSPSSKTGHRQTGSDLLILAPPPPLAAPEAPHISSVDYVQGVLLVRWTYGELFVDLSHSRLLHWEVLAVGRKGLKRTFSLDVSQPRPQLLLHWARPLALTGGGGVCRAGDPDGDAGEAAAASGRHLQPDGGGLHRAQPQHLHTQHHQAG